MACALILVLRFSPYFSFTLINSFLIISRTFWGVARIALNCSIFLISSTYSSNSLSLSRPVNWCNLISRIAWAWALVNLKFSINAFLAASTSFDFSIMLTTLFIFSTAFFNPSRMWARSSAFSSSNFVRRVTISFRYSRYWISTSLRFSMRGTLFTRASIITPKVVSICVWLNNWLRTICEFASRFSSMTTRIPLRSDSSRRLLIPSIFLSLTRFAIVSRSCALFTW